MNIVRQEAPSTPTTTTSWDPFQRMREIMKWDPFAPSFWGREGKSLAFFPDVDIKETPEAYVFTADLPGMKDKDVEVAMTGNRLTIKGKREEEKKEEKDTYYSCERSYGSFVRTFTLPDGVDMDKATANLKDGVLNVMVPRKPQSMPKKIKVGQ